MADGYYVLDEQTGRRMVRSTLYTERMNRGGGGGTSTPTNLNQLWWPFRNDYTGTVPSYGVVAITGVVEVTATSSTIYTGDRPGTTFRQLYGVNSSVEVAEGEYGMLTLTGPCYIAYDSGTPAAGEGWGPKPGQFTLSKGFPGGTIVSGIQDSTNKLLLGTLAPITVLLGKTTGAITGGTASSAYGIWCGVLDSEADSGFTTVPSSLSRVDIDSGKFVKLTWHNNGWLMEPLECNA